MKKRRNKNNITFDLNWSNDFSPEQQRSEWMMASNILWDMEREGQVNKKDLENSIIEYMKKENFPRKDIMKMTSVKEYDKNISFCITAYLLNNGYEYSPSKEYLNNTIRSLLNKKYEAMNVVKTKPVKIDSFQAMLDVIEKLETKITNKCPDFSKEFLDKGCNKQIAEKLISIYKPIYEEYEEGYNGNPEVLEGYRRYNKKDFKLRCKWYKTLLDSLEEYKNKKVTTTVRKTKPKSPSQLVSKLKYMKKYDELALISFDPTYIIGAKCITLYNTKTRVFSVYIGNSLTLTGTTIQNFDDESSMSKILRNPAQQLKKLSEGTKLKVLNEFNNLTTKSKVPSGRVNADTILLGFYKK